MISFKEDLKEDTIKQQKPYRQARRLRKEMKIKNKDRRYCHIRNKNLGGKKTQLKPNHGHNFEKSYRK